ncbi:MFS transporter [Burkholderia sp. 3C]
MSEHPGPSLEEFIDARPLSARQLLIAVLCFLAVLLDGFDSILVGFIAPSIRAAWQLSPAQLAPLFGSGVVGLMIGALAIGPLADRYGRKTVLVASVAAFGLLTLVSAAAPSLPVLIVLRLLAGLGLGAAMPGAITLTAEYCPRRHRAIVVTAMFCGFTGGAAISGMLAAWLIGDFGWRAVLVAGGVLPLALVVAMLAYLPESVRFLALRPGRQAAIAAILARIAPAADLASLRLPSRDPAPAARPTLRRLLAPDMRGGTLLIWVVYVSSLLVLLFLNSWLPTLLLGMGVPLAKASMLAATFQLGGTFGAIALGYLMDRYRACLVLTAAFLAGALALLGIDSIGTASAAWVPVLVLIGIGTGGAQTGAHVVTTSFYDTASRSTGMSWALGVGRIGSVVGSMSGGYMLAGHWPSGAMFGLMALCLAIAAAGSFALSRHPRLRGGSPAADTPATRSA